MFALETGFPVPQNPRSSYRYPFSEMEIGQSFFVPDTDGKNVRSAVSGYAAKHPVKFRCKSTEGGIRVWRIA